MKERIFHTERETVRITDQEPIRQVHVKDKKDDIEVWFGSLGLKSDRSEIYFYVRTRYGIYFEANSVQECATICATLFKEAKHDYYLRKKQLGLW